MEDVGLRIWTRSLYCVLIDPDGEKKKIAGNINFCFFLNTIFVFKIFISAKILENNNKSSIK